MSYNPIPGADGRVCSFVRWHHGRLECRNSKTAVILAGLLAGMGGLGCILGLLELLTGGRVHPIGQAAPNPREGAQGLVMGLFVLIFGLLLLLIAATRGTDLTLDPADRTYRLRRGVWRWTTFSEGSFDEFAGLRLTRYRRGTDLLRSYYRLSLVWKDGRRINLALWVTDPVLLRGREAHADARAYMRRLAERLGLAARDNTHRIVRAWWGRVPE